MQQKAQKEQKLRKLTKAELTEVNRICKNSFLYAWKHGEFVIDYIEKGFPPTPETKKKLLRIHAQFCDYRKRIRKESLKNIHMCQIVNNCYVSKSEIDDYKISIGRKTNTYASKVGDLHEFATTFSELDLTPHIDKRVVNLSPQDLISEFILDVNKENT